MLAHAADLASMEGLDGLSIGRLATEADVSKSGIATLFGSKEQLQLATVAAAAERFTATVVEPARVQPRGIRRLAALLDRVVAYSEDRVFPGGCFFSASAADFHSKPGAVRDALADQLESWLGYLAASARFAVVQGELPGLEDPDQLAFELQGTFEWMNLMAVIREKESAVHYGRARTAYRGRLIAYGGDPEIAELLLVPGAALR
ncbi:TetR/AcrR family transcriptional regulator [Agromyces salentinus]|uniref:TetR/AcrR family transcriptional regulator n=1 Tax=Agromyces salentinus TaxID=269421 RepID=A0ABP4YT51_9MICO